MKRTLRAASLFLTAGWLACFSGIGRADVVINEIMFHPPDDRDDLQWVELLNAGDAPVDLKGWTFTKGIGFTFTNATLIPPRGFVVVSRDVGAFRIRYGPQSPVFGEFTGKLSHSGEKIELANAAGTVVDRVRFDTTPPWPASPDGASPSLERIVAAGPGDAAENWAPSRMPEFSGAAGTPGRTNDAARDRLPPVIADVGFGPPSPGLPIAVSASVSSRSNLAEVRLEYEVLDATGTPADSEARTKSGAISMSRTSGDLQRGVFAGEIPGQPANRIVRFRIAATDSTGATRVHPNPNDLRPTLSWFVNGVTNDARIPFALLVQSGPAEREGESLRAQWRDPRRTRRGAPGTPARGNATLVLIPVGGSPPEVFDHIRLTPRQGGWKVRLHKDRTVAGMSTVNVFFEYQPRFVLAEHLAYEVYREAGVPCPSSGHWRVSFNGQPLGYHLFVEQPNASFLRRTGLDPDGDLYKLLWYGRDVVGQHEKKNNPESGHARIVEQIESLRTATGNGQWQIIERNFDVDEFASYYAVNMCIQNWDGFFNNYFVHRAPASDGKWTIIPWDEDKTWGDHDGASPAYDWVSMPLTMGMAGDRPPRNLLGAFSGGGGPHGGPQWWRQGGWFSAPLLANPTFRARFLKRLAELCQTAFSPGRMEPRIAALERALEPEVRYRARTVGDSRNREIQLDYGVATARSEIPTDDESAALDQFRRHIASFRLQAEKRRAFILAELARDKRP